MEYQQCDEDEKSVSTRIPVQWRRWPMGRQQCHEWEMFDQGVRWG
jgi:hypothetical protein